MTDEVREPPGDRHAEPGGGRSEAVVEVGEGVLELASARLFTVARGDRSRDELVVERRDDDGDPVVVDDPQVSRCCSGGRSRAAARWGEVVRRSTSS